MVISAMNPTPRAGTLDERLSTHTSCSTSGRALQQGLPFRAAQPFKPARGICNRLDANSIGCTSSRLGPLAVYSPVQEEREVSLNGLPKLGDSTANNANNAVPANLDWARSSQLVSSAKILEPVKGDMEQMVENLRNVVGNRHPLLMAAADQIFGAGGKKLRPAIVFLVSRATAELAGLR